MPLTADSFFEQRSPEAGYVHILELGHRAKLLMQSRVDLATEVFSAQTHLGGFRVKDGQLLQRVEARIRNVPALDVPERLGRDAGQLGKLVQGTIVSRQLLQCLFVWISHAQDCRR